MPRHAVLQCLSLDHQSADVTLRGLLACSPDQIDELLTDPSRPAVGAFILSTCNRIELYWIGNSATADWWRARALALGVAIPFVHRRGRNAARHMVRVASGLESRMLGEREILGQMRTAIHRSRMAGTLGRRLGMIGDGAIACARRVRRASVLDRHARAASAAMVDWVVTQMGGSLRGRSALVLGAGQAAEGAVRALVEHGTGRIVLANRNPVRAEALAARHPVAVSTAGWDQLASLVRSADLIITATAAADPILGAAHLVDAGASRRADPIHVLDLGVPPNVELGVRGLTGVRVADLDALRSATCPEASTSAVALAEADALVEREIRQLARDVRARRLARTLAQLHALGEMVAAEEADLAIDAMSGLTDAERLICQQLGAKVARRILYRVSRVLREEAVQPRRRVAGAV